MARNGSGTMAVVNTFVDGTTITAAAHNTNFTDVASEITNSVAVDGQSAMTGQFKFASGTVGAPGVVPGSDLDTGVYRIGGDNLGVACAGAKVLDIATTGLGVTGTLSATGAITENGAAVYKAGGTDVAVADGGTGASTATLGFNALAPTTTRGDLITRDASNNVRLAVGAANRVLRSDGTDPAWGQVVNSDITDATIAHAKLASGVTASQAVMETGTATDSYVAPGRQHFHPGHPKFWAFVTVTTGTPTLQTSYNVTSITDGGAGDLLVTIATDFSSANWCGGATVGASTDDGETDAVGCYTYDKQAGTIHVIAEDGDEDAGQGDRRDPQSWNVWGFGDHA